MLPHHRGGAFFCTRGTVQGYDVDLFFLVLAKTVFRQLAEVPDGRGGGPWRALVFARRL
jgi:hypothetical protein